MIVYFFPSANRPVALLLQFSHSLPSDVYIFADNQSYGQQTSHSEILSTAVTKFPLQYTPQKDRNEKHIHILTPWSFAFQNAINIPRHLTFDRQSTKFILLRPHTRLSGRSSNKSPGERD